MVAYFVCVAMTEGVPKAADSKRAVAGESTAIGPRGKTLPSLRKNAEGSVEPHVHHETVK